MNFHEIRFPTSISLGADGGPERRTDVVVLGSGYEERNSRWANSRRSYNAGYGVKSLDDLHAVIAFFEERRGKLYGFRWKDHTDFRSGVPLGAVTAFDQPIGVGNGTAASFQLKKTYGSAHAPWVREVTKPVVGTVLVAVDGVVKSLGTHFSVNAAAGIVTFVPAEIPAAGLSVTAGFEFDVPVRFDTDSLEISLSGFRSGAIPHIPVIEVRV